MYERDELLACYVVLIQKDPFNIRLPYYGLHHIGAVL